MSKTKNLALIGNPNSGKTSLFNLLSGLNQQVSNLSGTSVEVKKATFKTEKSGTIKLTDLPGIYSLSAHSKEEEIAANEILEEAHTYDLFIFTLDATSLRRGLFLYSQIANLGKPIIVALTMTDLASKMGISVNIEELSKELGCIVIPLSTRSKQGIPTLTRHIDNEAYGYHNILLDTKEWTGGRSKEVIQNRYRIVDEILKKTRTKASFDPLKFTKKVDKYVTHPVYGFLFFALIMFIVFQTVYSLADYPMNWIDSFFAYLGTSLNNNLPEAWYSGLLINGIIPGISGVVIFLPQIVLLFAMLSILEETGYMSRVSFVSDKLMRKVGLNGKSVIPMVGGLACAVPSIMACRTIPNKKERLLSMLVLPFMSCSARLPVYLLLIGMLTTEEAKTGIVNTQGLILFALYFLGFAATMGVAFIVNFFLKNDEKTSYIMEMPLYRIPQLKNSLSIVIHKAGVFVKETGKIILIVSMVLWALASYGPSEKREQITKKYNLEIQNHPYNSDSLNKVKSGELLEHSYAGILGKTIEPAIRPMGYDWKIGIGILTSFAAREVFVGTMATIYSLDGEEEDSKLLKTKLESEIDPRTGKPLYTVPLIISLLLFFTFAMQCMSTLAVLYKETGSIKWPLIQFTIMSGLAYFLSTMVYQFFS